MAVLAGAAIWELEGFACDVAKFQIKFKLKSKIWPKLEFCPVDLISI